VCRFFAVTSSLYGLRSRSDFDSTTPHLDRFGIFTSFLRRFGRILQPPPDIRCCPSPVCFRSRQRQTCNRPSSPQSPPHQSPCAQATRHIISATRLVLSVTDLKSRYKRRLSSAALQRLLPMSMNWRPAGLPIGKDLILQDRS
jgi:hypothetical protein